MKKQTGQAVLEMAICLPIFIFVGLGMADFVWCLERTSTLEYVVNETARCQAINATQCATPALAVANAYTLAANLRMTRPNLVVIAGETYCIYGSQCIAAATYKFAPVGIYFPSVTIRRNSSAALPPIS